MACMDSRMTHRFCRGFAPLFVLFRTIRYAIHFCKQLYGCFVVNILFSLRESDNIANDGILVTWVLKESSLLRYESIHMHT